MHVNRTRQRNHINRCGQGRRRDGGGRGHNGGGRHVAEAVLSERTGGGDGDRGSGCSSGRGAQNGVRFGGAGYLLLRNFLLVGLIVRQILTIQLPINMIQRLVASLFTGLRRSIRKIMKRKLNAAHVTIISELGTQARTKLYTRADTLCAEVKFWLQELIGETPDISEWLDFDFHDRVWWLDKKHPATTDDDITLGRWIGISQNIGSYMCYWVLTVSGNVISGTLVCHVTWDELLDPVLAEKVAEFDIKLKKRLYDTNFVNPEAGDLYIDELDKSDEASHGEGSQTPYGRKYADMIQEELPEKNDVDDKAYDKYIGAEVMMDVPVEGKRCATVNRRVDNIDGNKSGTYHQNSMMDTREYKLE